MPPGAPHLLLYILSLVQVSGVPELGETKSEYMKDHGQEAFENLTLSWIPTLIARSYTG